MTNKHLTEEELQQYVIDGLSTNKEIAAHIHICEVCSGRAEEYRLLFKGIKGVPAPVFDFDLQEMVLSQLPSPPAEKAGDNFSAWIFILPGLIFAALAFYLFKDYFIDLFAGITSIFIYLSVISILVLLIVLSVDMYQTHEKKMKSLDLS